MSKKAIAWVNFFLADVRDGLAPFLAIYLLTDQKWQQDKIGLVLTVTTLATLIAQTPAGAFIDHTRYKRTTLIITSLIIGLACIGITWFPSLYPVLLLKMIVGAGAAFIAPAIAGITLGLVRPEGFSQQVGTNEAFNHAGNIVAALGAGLVGYYFSNAAIFYLIFFTAVAATLAILCINPKQIDYNVARGLDIKASKRKQARPSSFKTLFQSRTLLIFTIAATLFHFANAAMLPMLGEKLASANVAKASSLFMSACIIVAQFVMIPMAIIVGRKANLWGRRRIFLIAFLLLPIRGMLYTFSDNTVYLISIQILDGICAGIYGALFMIVIADLTMGSGHYNITLGAASTVVGIGQALSTLIAGEIVTHTNYNFAFITLAAIALFAFLLYFFGVPETQNWHERRHAFEKT